jgi:pimeloyl-ACP methyl ester carboxylesterase
MPIFTNRDGASVAYVERGDGVALLALHGAYSTHAEIEAALEPIVAPLGSYRRIYPDLPGMGDSPGHPTLRHSNDVIALLEQLVDELVGEAPVIVVGHSYGAHLGRGLAARRTDQVSGLALLCPLVAGMVGEPHVVDDDDGSAPTIVPAELFDDFAGYFVVHTADAARRFVGAVAPSIGRYDGEVVEQIMGDDALTPDPDSTPYTNPVLLVVGRGDSLVGYRRQLELADGYQHATSVLVDGAGHALPHERPELLGALLLDWFQRTERERELPA